MKNKPEIIEISENLITPALLDNFERLQKITYVYRGPHGNKTKQHIPFTEIWDKTKKQNRISELYNTIKDGGTVFGLFDNNALIGFASIGGNFIDSKNMYRQLIELHISAAYRGRGYGKLLFQACVNKLRTLGVKMMYISSHSSVETVSFYKYLGCKDAQWLYIEQIRNEPFDYQLEFALH